MKQVFRFLINEAPYLIDEKALERCQGESPKEQLKIKIDSIRKALSIQDMGEVDLLVKTLYNYQAKYEQEKREEEDQMRREEEEDEANQQNGEGGAIQPSSVD